MKYRKYAEALCGYMASFHRGPGKRIKEMSRGEMAMMYCITAKMDGHTPVEISRELEISSAAVASTMNKLENKGLIKRKADSTDRRKVTVHLTKKGRDFSREREEEMMRDLATLLEVLDEDEVKALVSTVRKLSESAEVK